MELENYARVAIIGGGPAGSLTAFFLLRLAREMGQTLQVEIFEPRDFSLTGPPGCNMCGGVISESLMQKMATEGIQLPREVLLDAIDSYVLHTGSGSVAIRPGRDEMRIASIFRGAGPAGAESQQPLPWLSFDRHLLELAKGAGARHVPRRVRGLARDAGNRLLLFLQPERGAPRRGEGELLQEGPYDLLVGCVGLNGSGVKLFDDLAFGYRPPPSDRAWIGELYMGDEEVHRRLGNAMHVFLLNIPRLKFAALTPKGHYATLIILGQDVDEALADQVLRSPEMQALLPVGWQTPVRPCHCQPRINLGAPHQPFADRVVLVGDCASSRLYKDGIGAAYRMAKACALTVMTRGVGAEDFRQGYWPACRRLDRDNLLGHLMFSMDGLMRHVPPFRKAMLAVVDAEQQDPADPRRLGSALWDTFTGSATYIDIFRRAAHPLNMYRLGMAFLRAVFLRSRA
ncbi:MAG: hypothetical protein HQL96_00865 [Magnetococcales bacterium]|nr:hypothetical protein [Magnetococcales bacterium]